MSSKLLFSLFLLLPIPIVYDIIKIFIFQNYLFVVLLLRLQLVLVFLLFLMSGPRQNLGFLVFSRFSWFSLFYLGILGFLLEKKNNLVNLVFLLEIQKNPSNSWFFAGNPRIPK